MDGWISIHRQIKKSWLWQEKPFTKGQAWTDLLLEANFTQGTQPIGNKVITIERGQVFWSVEDMAKSWGWSRHKVSNFLNLLEKEDMIKQNRTTKYTILTIVNYEFYQSQGQQKDISGTSTGHQRDTNNNKNNTNLSYLYNNDGEPELSEEAKKKFEAISKGIFGKG